MCISGLNWLKNRAFFTGLAICVLILAGCNSNKQLLEGETFLESNNVEIRSESKIKNKSTLKAGLEDLYRQSETRTFMGLPRHTFYYAGLNNPDSAWFKRWLNSKIGDPPVLFDTSKVDLTVEAMTQYLKRKGYWNAKVSYASKQDNYRTKVEYNVDPKQRWTVASVTYRSPDSTIQEILDSLAQDSKIGPGSPVDNESFEADRNRITLAMQNLGYANFFKNYIAPPIADSAENQMNLEINVQNPDDEPQHRKFGIGEIRIYPDFTNDAILTIDTIIDGVRFLSPQYPFLVKPHVLLRDLYFRTGDEYHFNSVDKTRKQLNKLATYRFVNVKPFVNPNDSTVLDYDITLARNKTMGIGGDFEFNYSTLSASSQSLFGVGIDLNYRHRNIFKGAELFTSNLEVGVEFNLKNTVDLINSFNINFQNNFLIPKFIDPLGFYTGMNKLKIGKKRILGDKIFQWISEDNSRVNLGYQYLSLVNLYDYHTANFSIGYDAQPDLNRRLQINHFGIDLFSPTTKPQFDTILNTNQYLRESFVKQLFTGVLFKDYRFEYRGPRKGNGFSSTFIHSGEISGLEVLALNGLVNALTKQSGQFAFGRNENPITGVRDSITFAQFLKLEFDSHFSKLLKGNQELAFRAAIGLAFPYGPFSVRTPYVKQFYIGGPQSLRAWQIRELGPGAFEDLNVPADAVQFYQSGDFKIELAAEYRFKIGWIMHGAFFVDAGNVWTITKDDDRPGAALSTSFLDEIAIGTGTGLRLDFDYFVIRWDLGYKLRNPYPDENGDHWLWKNFKSFSWNQFNSNFAIGYPF
jgi:outer membrane translocation and assembly module TamA